MTTCEGLRLLNCLRKTSPLYPYPLFSHVCVLKISRSGVDRGKMVGGNFSAINTFQTPPKKISWEYDKLEVLGFPYHVTCKAILTWFGAESTDIGLNPGQKSRNFLVLKLEAILALIFINSRKKTYGRSPVWVRSCTCSVAFWANFFSQKWQSNGFSPVWQRLWDSNIDK